MSPSNTKGTNQTEESQKQSLAEIQIRSGTLSMRLSPEKMTHTQRTEGVRQNFAKGVRLGGKKGGRWMDSKKMYQIARRTVTQEHPDYLVMALDPVNSEKPYTKKLEG
jgi:hypothetical protein